MLSKIQKYLTIFLILSLAACTPFKPKQNSGHPTLPSQPNPAYPASTSYPEPVQTSTISITTTEPVQQQTQTPSITPSSSPLLTLQSSPSLRIAQLHMFDVNTGWAVFSTPYIRPEDSKILRTMDGIQTWIDVTPPIFEHNSIIRATFFVDENTAIVVSSHSSLPESPAVQLITWRTTNGGQTWQVGETFEVGQTSEFYPVQFFFLDSEQGWMLGESDSGMGNKSVHFFWTRDGGMHWEIVYDTENHLSDPDTLWIKGYYPYSEHFTFISNTTGFFSDGRLFGSQDGGKSWIFKSLDPPIDLPDIDCKDGYCRYFDAVSAPQFTSLTDGTLIRRVYLNTEAVMDVFVYYPNTLNRLSLPTAQYLYVTHDGGQTWVSQPLPVKIGTVYFNDSSNGWLLGKNDPGPATPTQFYQTTDSGKTWIQISTDCQLPLGSEFQFKDAQSGFAFYPYVVSDYYKDFDVRIKETIIKSYLFFTNDGGKTWIIIEPRITP